MPKICPSMQTMIGDIMNEGEKLDSTDILNKLYAKVEERRNSNTLGYYKGHSFPTKLQLTFFLKANYKKELNNKQTFLFWK
tara:strand:- start:45 stop:287 length:243 start_codon:yes stop_codon:yes gene_type:complete